MPPRSPHFALLGLLLLGFFAGCGGGGDGAGGGTDPAAVAPADSPLYVGFTVRPEGEQREDLEALAEKIGGVDDLGGLILSELESSATASGAEFDYATEVEPWLGDRGGFFARSYDGDDFTHYGVAFQATDEDGAEEFLEKQADAGEEPYEDGSYEEVDFKLDPVDGTVVGAFDGVLLLAEDEAAFEAAVDASKGDALAAAGRFEEATADLPSDSVADVYVDIGGLIRQAGSGIDPDAQTFLDAVGIDPSAATALAGFVPGSEQLEVDFSTDVLGEDRPNGNAAAMLGSLPADAVAAFAGSEFGKQVSEGIDQIDAAGIPGEVPPNQLKQALKQSGVDLDAITGSIGDVGAFAVGSNARNLGGAVVLQTEGEKEATNTVANVGTFLRATGTPGITATTGEASGFSVRSPDLGRQPLIVAAEGERIAVGYGLSAADAALEASGETLADTPAFKQGQNALGDTPISAFLDGPAALTLASDLIPPGERDFTDLKRYLAKIDYVAIGSEASGERATAKLIFGIGK